MEFGKYQFLSWARRGVSKNISQTDTLGASSGSAKERANIKMEISVNGTNDPIGKDFLLAGPGDIIGIEKKMIVRTEPLHGISDFEPNLLPYIEFYDEDFAWRYTPASPAGAGERHLRPWLALIVLKETEFADTERVKPLPSILLESADPLPPPDELHLWAHMHSNLPHTESDFTDFLDGLQKDAALDPDGIFCRLMCPRKLQPKQMYHAFLVPSYETGRLAGLGRPTTEVKAQQHSFAADLEFPYYHRWYFRTSENFDFEYLVKQLEPRVMDSRVGVRPMDCSKPAFVQANSENEVEPPIPEILMLEGAMKSPNAEDFSFPTPGVAQPFIDNIKDLANLNRVYPENTEEDPFVTIPFYGMNHAIQRNASLPGKKEIPEFENNTHWYNDLNRDPRTRVPAGFGTRVVQNNQDKFMDSAWEQLGSIIEANNRMKTGNFIAGISERMYAKHVVPQKNESLISFVEPLAGKVLYKGKTASFAIQESLLPKTVFQPAFRRLVRNKTALAKGLGIPDPVSQTFSLVDSMNKPNGISAYIPITINSLEDVKNKVFLPPPSSLSKIKVWSVQSNLDENYLYNLKEHKGGLPSVTLWDNRFHPLLFSTNLPRISVTRPSLNTLNLGRANRINRARLGSNQPLTNISTNSSVINRFSPQKLNAQVKKSFTDYNVRFGITEEEVKRNVLKVVELTSSVKNQIRPYTVYKEFFDARIQWPERMKKSQENNFIPAMAYPDLPEPTYKYLLDIDEEFLLPNLQLIPPNTFSLLRTNQKFIEAYLVGLNHEMGLELRWREFPTDLRGSYFRQFWDIAGIIRPDSTPEDSESMKDIDPIHTWNKTSKLGTHNKRESGSDTEQLIFVIRGELLKKFPNTVIYAQKALKDPEDPKKRIIREDGMTEELYQKEVKFPLYQAEIKPDIKLLGFDLTTEEASGEKLSLGNKYGWFFVIAEVPGEPHFGMDISFNPNQPGDRTKYTWNDLSWENFRNDLKFIRRDTFPDVFQSTTEANTPATGIWGKSSADMASILMQRPVMVAIHSTEMLDVNIPANPLILNKYTTLKNFALKRQDNA